MSALTGNADADNVSGAVIVSVDVPGFEPTATEPGEIPHVANGAGPVTIQVNATVPENPFCPVRVNWSGTWPPVCVVKVVDAGVKVKSAGGLNVAVTVWLEFIVRLQAFGSVPVQAPLHAVKTDGAAGTAVSETDVPGA
jgi:hypothetical protein